MLQAGILYLFYISRASYSSAIVILSEGILRYIFIYAYQVLECLIHEKRFAFMHMWQSAIPHLSAQSTGESIYILSSTDRLFRCITTLQYIYEKKKKFKVYIYVWIICQYQMFFFKPFFREMLLCDLIPKILYTYIYKRCDPNYQDWGLICIIKCRCLDV